jgi:putative CocE/NonD family hydrolase
VFETGRNQWRRHDAWPPAGATTRSLYLRAGGRLAFEPPPEAGSAYDEYVSDPARPVPYTNAVAISMTREHMIDDQRFASARPDVLTYVTEVLEDEVTVAGPITPSLKVSTSGTDSDWVVKLIDVYPDNHPDPGPTDANSTGGGYSRVGGYQQLVRGEAMRGKFRSSYEKPEPFVPGQITKVEYVMPDVYHTFRRGHRIAVQIQSSWFPLVNLNPQTFCNINTATAAMFQKAVQRVYRGKDAATEIKLTVLGGS